MKKYFYQLLVLLFFIFLTFQVQAENTLGGTLDFTHKSGNVYTLKATVYVDKAAKATSPDLYTGFLPAKIYSKGSTIAGDALVQTVNITFDSRVDDIAYENQSCASSIPVSTSKIIYSIDITLNKASYNNPNGYYIACVDGNRNPITNVNNANFIGMTMYLEFPRLDANDNSSPSFNLKKGYVACVNQPLLPLNIDLSASDADAGDTRTYRLVNPYSGGGDVNKQNLASSITSRNPSFISGSSYENGFILVPFIGGLSASNPIIGTGISLDPNTGILTGTPTQVGKYLVCVECREFRAGTLIGSNRMDFQIVVDNCVNPIPKIYLEGNTPTVHENSAVICDGSYRVLETVNNANFTYVWKKDNVVVPGANKYQYKVVYANAGKYTVTVTRTGGCPGTEISKETELLQQQGVNIKIDVPDSTVCSNFTPIPLNVEKSDGTTLSNSFGIRWFRNDVLIPTAPSSPSQPYFVSASGKYKVIATDFTPPPAGFRCTYEAFKEVIVTPIPTPTITNVTNKTIICQGESVKLRIATTQTGVNYFWVRNSANFATTNEIDVNTSGAYELRGESTVNTSCVAYAPNAIVITVNALPTINFDPIPPVCSSKSAKVDLRNLVTVSPPDPNFGTFTGTGVRGYEFDPSVSGYGSFSIKYDYKTAAGCSSSASKIAIVDLSPNVKLGNDATIFRGDTIKLKSVGNTGSNYVYEWTPTTGLNFSNIPQPIAKPDVTTEYVVKVTSVLGRCPATDKITITVKSILKIPSAFTPNSDAINDTWTIMDNTREFNDYPDIEVKIFNRWGGEIFNSFGSGAYQTKPFDGIQEGQRLPAGTYFYVIKPSPDVPSLTGYVTIVR